MFFSGGLEVRRLEFVRLVVHGPEPENSEARELPERRRDRRANHGGVGLPSQVAVAARQPGDGIQAVQQPAVQFSRRVPTQILFRWSLHHDGWCRHSPACSMACTPASYWRMISSSMPNVNPSRSPSVDHATSDKRRHVSLTVVSELQRVRRNVCDVDDCRLNRKPFRLPGLVMIPDRFLETLRQLPLAEEGSADRGVIRSP